jgi:uncharacterized protein with PQ loop repeat
VEGIPMHAIGEIFGFIGGAIGVATALPQVLRIRKLGHADGLALSPWVLMIIQFAAWTAFGLKVSSPSILFANLLTFFTTALVVVAIVGNKALNWLLICVTGLAIGLFVFYGPGLLVDWAMIVLTGSRLPQLIQTWFNRASVKPTAVSIPSLIVALVSMLFWMAFALLTENSLVTTTTAVAITITVLTAVLEGTIAKRASEVHV